MYYGLYKCIFYLLTYLLKIYENAFAAGPLDPVGGAYCELTYSRLRSWFWGKEKGVWRDKGGGREETEEIKGEGRGRERKRKRRVKGI